MSCDLFLDFGTPQYLWNGGSYKLQIWCAADYTKSTIEKW